MAPELLYPSHFGFKDSEPTKESDCYALGMVILEVLSGKVPFSGYSTFDVMQKVIKGEWPERPKQACLTDNLWETLEECWSPQPKLRPPIKTVLRCLERASLAGPPQLFTVDDLQDNIDNRPCVIASFPCMFPHFTLDCVLTFSHYYSKPGDTTG